MDLRKISEFRERMKSGAVIGPFAKTSDPAFIEILGYTGFDFVIIDLEHGPNTIETAQNLLRAAEAAGVLPVVRVKENNLSMIGEALDIGACGVQVPQVNSAPAAEEVVRHAGFAPHGMRGVCRFVRAADYSTMDRFEYFKAADSALIVVHLEGRKALDNLDEIAAVEGIDVLFIGPYDLSQSMGVPGQIDHPDVEKAMREIVNKCRAAGKSTGTFVDTFENAAKWKEAGITYLSYSVDVGIFADACRECIGRLRAPANEE